MKLTIKPTTLVEEVDEYLEAKRVATEAARRLELAQHRLTQKMEQEHRKTYEVRDGGKIRKVTYVQNVSTSVDEEGLKKELGARNFNKLTTPKLDRKKLEKALDEGTLDPFTVGKHTQERPSKPFIRYTEGTADDQDE